MPLEEMIFYSSAKSPLFAKTNIDFILTSRNGGFSPFPYNTLNLAYHTGDKELCVLANRELVCKTFFPDKELLWLDQVHSNDILEINKKFYLNGFVGKGDAIVCSDKKFACMVMIADCNPILVYEPTINTFALIHAGREGVAKHIVSKTIKQILQNPNAKIENFVIFIGASIRKCCYEIGEEIAKNFDKKYLTQNKTKYKLDLIEMLKDELSTHNIQPSQIEVLPTCSNCEKNLFSYRREGVTGRFALIATLK